MRFPFSDNIALDPLPLLLSILFGDECVIPIPALGGSMGGLMIGCCCTV